MTLSTETVHTSVQTGMIFQCSRNKNLLDLTSKLLDRQSRPLRGEEVGSGNSEGGERRERPSQWETEMIKRLSLLTEKRGSVSIAASFLLAARSGGRARAAV